MKANLAVVVIPVYKPQLPIDEELSFRQTLTILKQYDICLLTFPELDISYYQKIADVLDVKLRTSCFDRKYFQSVNTYNYLMMSAEFYSSFSAYEYMLICQTDAWIFRDELSDWCLKGYDYIGAPWFKWSVKDNAWDKSSLDSVGNGGLSLRRIAFFNEAYKSRKLVFSPRKLLQEMTLRNPLSIIKNAAKMLGYHNNWNYYLKLCHDVTEDVFFCISLKGTQFEMNVPDPKEAAAFSFEVFPSECFQINGKKLPFGCHAYKRNEYIEFWSRFIPLGKVPDNN